MLIYSGHFIRGGSLVFKVLIGELKDTFPNLTWGHPWTRASWFFQRRIVFKQKMALWSHFILVAVNCLFTFSIRIYRRTLPIELVNWLKKPMYSGFSRLCSTNRGISSLWQSDLPSRNHDTMVHHSSICILSTSDWDCSWVERFLWGHWGLFYQLYPWWRAVLFLNWFKRADAIIPQKWNWRWHQSVKESSSASNCLRWFWYLSLAIGGWLASGFYRLQVISH